MRRNIGIVLMSVLIALTAFYVDAQTAEFNVATYNIRQLNKDDDRNGNGWSRRCPVVASVIKFHDFDIFGTQEGFKSQLEELKASLPGYEYIGVGRDDGKEEGEHSAIFYNMDLFEVVDHGDFWLSETPDMPGLGWDAACVRICSWGKFRHKLSGKEFLYFNLHMDHVGKKARVESARLVMNKMEDIDSGCPVLLSGDFNVDQTHDSYAALVSSGKLKDAYSAAEFVYAPNGTFNSYKADGFTTSRIDHIFVSPDIKVLKYGVLTDTYRTEEGASDTKATDAPREITLQKYVARTPSDHFPVKIRISID